MQRKFGLQKLCTGMLLFGMTVSCFSIASAKAAETDVAIDQTTFPDTTFQTYISDNFDKNKDGSLSQAERTAVTAIKVNEGINGVKITSVKGIEYFPELTSLQCNKNSLTDLDVSNNTKLTVLDCRNNQLENLDVTKNTQLQKLWFYGNQISSIDLNKNTELLNLACGGNPLTSLDLSQNKKLTELYCYNTQVTSLDVSNMKDLTELECFNNQLTSLNASGDTALKGLNCYKNSLTSLDLSGCLALTDLDCKQNQLTELNLSQNTNLEKLYCANNQLTSLDVSNNTKIESLDCSSNRLTTLNLENNTKIDYLRCVYNRLTNLDVSANIALRALYTSHNPLTGLDVSKNLNLDTLVCESNQLTSLEVSANTKLSILQCPDNQLTSLDISKNLNLSSLSCNDNQITGLDISNNPNLTTFDFSNNPIMLLKVTDSFSDRDLESSIVLVDTVQQDLDQCAGWDVSRISNITGGKLVGNVLEFEPMAEEVTYTYDCGYNRMLDVYLYIRLNEYPITYHLNGGTNAAANPASYYPVSEEISLKNPVKEGYTFDGWYEDAEFTKRITGISKGHVGNVTLYAKWTEIPKPTPVTPTPTPANPVTPTPPSNDQNNNKSQILPVGRRVTDKKSKAVYKVVKNSNKLPCMAYVKPTNKKASVISIPKTVTIKGVTYKVVSIEKNAFKNNTKLKKIVIPSTIESIGSKAFYGCRNLTRITIKTTKLTGKKIGSQAFTKAGSKRYNKLTVTVPKSKKKAYKTMLKKRGIHKKVKIK